MIKTRKGTVVGSGTAGTNKVQRFLRLAQVRELTGLATSLIYEMISQGTFPAPIKRGSHWARWSEDEIAAWQADHRTLTDFFDQELRVIVDVWILGLCKTPVLIRNRRERFYEVRNLHGLR